MRGNPSAACARCAAHAGPAAAVQVAAYGLDAPTRSHFAPTASQARISPSACPPGRSLRRRVSPAASLLPRALGTTDVRQDRSFAPSTASHRWQRFWGSQGVCRLPALEWLPQFRARRRSGAQGPWEVVGRGWARTQALQPSTTPPLTAGHGPPPHRFRPPSPQATQLPATRVDLNKLKVRRGQRRGRQAERRRG